MMYAIEFPFIRQTWYSLKELSDFEDSLLVKRRQNKQFDADLKQAKRPWMKLRNDELYPLRYFTQQARLAEDTQFMICEDGADADFELKVNGKAARRIQVTRAGPIWDSSDWGYDHKLHMEILNRKGQSSGWGPYREESDGSISNRKDMLSTEERNRAYMDGLVKVIEGKQHHRIPNCELIVHAVAYHEAMDSQTFASIANAALSRVLLNNFCGVYILDYGEGYFVERSLS